MTKNGVEDMDEVGDFTLPMVSARAGDVSRKRAEQLARWAQSETNQLQPLPRKARKTKAKKRVEFPEGCVFMAACASGDEEEVEELLTHGADINTSNVDGLTALHQAVIDENGEMVEFLLASGADVNAQDNEGWTALHAAVSCGFRELAAALLAKGASLAITNNDGELPSDLADDSEDSGPVKALLSREVRRLGLDLDAARDAERTQMLADAERWAAAGRIPQGQLQPHPRTGASPLHVAASKGYADILRLLLQAGADTEWRDADGWTPLHAALHWGEREAAEALASAGAAFDARSSAGQTPADVAEEGLADFIAQLRARTEHARQRPHKVPKLSPSQHPSDPVNASQTNHSPRKNSIPRLSTDDKHHLSKVDEAREAKELRSASEEETENEEPKRAAPPKPLAPKPSPPVVASVKTSQVPASLPSTSTSSVKVSVSIPASRPAPPSQPPPPLAVAKAAPIASVSTTATAAGVSSSAASAGVTVRPRQPEGAAGSSAATPVTVKLRNGSTMTPTPVAAAPHPPPPSHAPKPLVSAAPGAAGSEVPAPPSWRLTGKRVESSTVASTSASTSATVTATPSGYRPAPAAGPPPAKAPSVSTATTQLDPPAPSKPLASHVGSRGRSVSPGRSAPLSVPPQPMREEATAPFAHTASPREPAKPWTFSSSQLWSALRRERPPPAKLPVIAPLKFPSQPNVAEAVAEIMKRSGDPLRTSQPNLLGPIREFAPVKLKSFTPPYRAESEAERKAHSRKQRETRRSTQGVTLEQLKSAQEMVSPPRKTSEPVLPRSQAGQAPPPAPPSAAPETPPRKDSAQRLASLTSPTTPTSQASAQANPTSPGPLSPVPKWRSQALESAGSSPGKAEAPVTSSASNGAAKPAPPSFATSIAGITNRATRGLPSTPGKEEEGPEEAGEAVPAGSTPSAGPSLARRRIRKDRRSTGPVAQQDLDGAALLEKDAPDGPVLHPPVPSSPRAIPNTPRITHGPQSIAGYGGSRGSGLGSGSRVSSSGSLGEGGREAGPTDYKVLYERERGEREKLDRRVAELETQMLDLRRSPSETTRELEKLRADNVRLKDENGALIRVISKLSK